MADSERRPWHEQVAATIIEALERGTAPWVHPWDPGLMPSPPVNALTGKPYRGINQLWLSIQQYGYDKKDPRWCSYKQARELGAQVKKGARGTLVQYWKQEERRLIRDEQGRPVLDEQGRKRYEVISLERPRVFHAVVFHASQIDGLTPLPEQKAGKDTAFERHQAAERLLTASNAKIFHNQMNSAFYRPSTDEIHLPEKGQFRSPDGYYATALHELGHWTGHESRLSRQLLANPIGSAEYAREELRAEIASYMLGMELGIGHDPGQHHAYIEAWIKILKNDSLEIIRAARDADQIRGYIMGLEKEKTTERAPDADRDKARYSATSVKPWRADFPKLFAHTTIAAMKRHPDYQAAKNGDVQAAERFVAAMVKPERVRELVRRYPDAIVVPVAEIEGSGHKNAIPEALAVYIAKEGNLRFSQDIVQISAVRRTNLNAAQRLINRKEFAGEVQQGATYIMVDDVATQGGTFHELRHYLANNGADAVAAASLAFSRGNNIIPIQEQTVNELAGRFGRERLEECLIDNNISGTLEALTEGEGRAICRFKSFESLRDRIAEERTQGSDSLSDAGQGTPDYRLIHAVFGEEGFIPLAPALTAADLAAVFPKAHITPSTIPGIHGFTVEAGNVVFTVRTCERISPDESVFSLAYGREMQADERIAGAVRNGEILIAHIGDRNTLRHESWHLIEDLGLVTPKERDILNRAALKAVQAGKLPDISLQAQPAERRAWYVERQLARREFDRGTAEGQALQKMADLVDALANLARRTERGILRDLESGELFEREPGAQRPSAEHYSAAGENIQVAGDATPAEARMVFEKLAPHLSSDRTVSMATTGGVMQHRGERMTAREKTWLNVPYVEKDQARAAGARWDGKAKRWYAPAGTDLQPLQPWLSVPEKSSPQSPAVLNPCREFGEVLRAAGLVIEGDPVMDGQIHRVPVAGGRSGAKDGAYSGHEDGHPNGWWQNYRSGERGKWLATGHVLTSEAKAILRKESAEKLADREELRKEDQARAMKRAYAKWMNAEPASPDHPYLTRKGVAAYNLRQDKHGNLMVPGYDEHGRIQTLEYINKDGAKWYEKDCPKKGAMAMLPDQDALKGEVILMVEGYATGASVHQATGLPVAVAFDAGNIKDAALAIKRKMPGVKLTICADNDARISDDRNVGVLKAKEAAAAVGAKVVVADFSKSEQERRLTDFNDLHQTRGLGAVRDSIMAKVNEAEAEKER